jgi:RND family efflux transporter MFP subunit
LAEGAVARADADAALARLDASRAALRAAEEELALVEAGARAEQIAAAEGQWQAAKADSAAARAAAGQIAVLERSLQAARAAAEQAQAAVAGARSLLAETEITAPISGWVGRRYLDVGDVAAPGTPLFLITDNDRLWVTAEVDEEDLALVRRGQNVEVTAEALAEPLPGKVAEVGPVAVSRGLEQVRAKIIRCKVVLEHGRELLKPGMEVDVSARTTLARRVLLAPSDAVVESEGKAFVRLVTQDIIRRRQVTPGRSNYQETEITAGLSEGDLVVVAGGEDLDDGRRVTVRREQGDGG